MAETGTKTVLALAGAGCPARVKAQMREREAGREAEPATSAGFAKTTGGHGGIRACPPFRRSIRLLPRGGRAFAPGQAPGRGCPGMNLGIGEGQKGSIEEVANSLLKEHRAGKGDLAALARKAKAGRGGSR